MKKNTYVIIAIFLGSLFAFAQRHEIGVQFGTSNLVGDIGKGEVWSAQVQPHSDWLHWDKEAEKLHQQQLKTLEEKINQLEQAHAAKK